MLNRNKPAITGDLKAAKIDDDSQILVNAKNRGGIWQVNSHAQPIFIAAQKVFHEASKDFKTNINCQILVSKVLNDMNVTHHFKQICEKSSIKVNKEIAINLLETLANLYIRDRSHSFAKSVREKHKVASKKGPLRTEMKKPSCSKDLGH